MPLRVLVQPFVTDKTPTTQELQVIVTVWNKSRDFALLQEMRCSWEEAYCVDKPALRFEASMCSSNFMQARRLSPGQKITHARRPLRIYQPLPKQIRFCVGLVQPDIELTSQEKQELTTITREGQNLPDRIIAERGRGRMVTYWSQPVTIEARTRWWNVDQDFIQVIRRSEKPKH